jgi:hypothetical protein
MPSPLMGEGGVGVKSYLPPPGKDMNDGIPPSVSEERGRNG